MTVRGSRKAEYQFVDLGSETVPVIAATVAFPGQAAGTEPATQIYKPRDSNLQTGA
jgi:hypothetical protein